MSWNQCSIYGCDNEGTDVLGQGVDDVGEFEIRYCSVGENPDTVGADVPEHAYYKDYFDPKQGYETLNNRDEARAVSDQWNV